MFNFRCNKGIITAGNSCNGEMLAVPVIRKEDGHRMMLLMQSAPAGPRRSNVSIYYKGLELRKDYTPEDIARDWEGAYLATDIGSAYSVMARLSNGKVGFMYEEKTYEIIAAFYDRVYYKYEDCFKFYQFIDAEDEAHFQEAIDYFKKTALYDTGVTAEYGDKLITLVTCAYHVDNGRFVVVAKDVTDRNG